MSVSRAPIPLAQWSLFRSQLKFAYDRLVTKRKSSYPYVQQPIAAWLIRSGSLTIQFESGAETYEAGTWVFPKDSPGIQELSSGLRILSLRFHAEWSYGPPIFSRKKTVTIAAETVPQLTKAAESLVSVVQKRFPGVPIELVMHGGFDEYLGIQAPLMQWIEAYHTTLSSLGVPANTLQSLDEKVCVGLQLIETHPLNTPLREVDLSRAVCCSISNLNRLFVNQIGVTPVAVFNQRRLTAAKAELINGSESIKTIAYRLGFSAPEHMAHWFKKNTGYSPTELRSLYKAGESNFV